MVDESHSAGVVGKTDRGVTELYNCREGRNIQNIM